MHLIKHQSKKNEQKYKSYERKFIFLFRALETLHIISPQLRVNCTFPQELDSEGSIP